MDDLRDLLGAFSEAQSGQSAGADAYLVGGFLAAYWNTPLLRRELSDSLLYYPTLVVLDPLAEFFDDHRRLPPTRPLRVRRSDGQNNTINQGPQLWSTPGTYGELRKDRSAASAVLARIVRELYELETPIRAGAVVLRSQWPVLGLRSHPIDASVRADVKSQKMQDFVRGAVASGGLFTVWDNMASQGPLVTAPGIVAADAPWEFQHIFYYLAKSLALADAVGAQYVPSTDNDLDLLRAKSGQVAHGRHPAEFLSEVARIAVPNVAVPIKEAAAVRSSSVEFDEWRRMLSTMQRLGGSLSPADLRQFVEDEMVPLVRKVEREVQARSLSRSGGGGAAEFVFDVAKGGVPTALVGASVGAAVLAGGATGVLGWIQRHYGPTSSSSPVLATLIKRG